MSLEFHSYPEASLGFLLHCCQVDQWVVVGGFHCVGGDYALGATGGAATHTLTTDEMPTHSHTADHFHTITDPGHFHDLPVNAASADGQQAWKEGGNPYSDGFNSASNTTGITQTNSTSGLTTSNQGSGQAHNNMQPYIVLNYIVKVK